MSIERDLMLAQHASPYDMPGSEAGGHVLDLLENLLAPKTPMPFEPGETPRWDDADIEAFDSIIELDGDMRSLDPGFDPEDGGTGITHKAWQQLTPSLPFGEGERNWFIHALRRPSCYIDRPTVRARFPNAFLPAEATVISEGVQQRIEPGELVRRWASWRREADEFAGQGNITRAIFLLNHLAYELVPKMFTTSGFRKQYPHVADFDARVRRTTRF